MILLSYTDVETENVMINKMLTYVHNQNNTLTQEEIIQVMISFYKKFNISSDFQNSRQMLKKFFNLLKFNNTQFEISDDYEKIVLNKNVIILDYEQLKNMIEYNHEELLQKKQNKENKIISVLDEKTNKRVFSHLTFIYFNDNVYIPCIFSICLCAHYITIIYTQQGLVIYDDLKDPILIQNEQQINSILTQITNIEFIGYVKKK